MQRRGSPDDVKEQLLKLARLKLNPTRIAILLYLLARGRCKFSELYKELKLTPGNAWSHLEKLEKEGLVEIRKMATSKGVFTYVSITEKGYDLAEELVFIMSSLGKLRDSVPGGSEGSEGS